MGRFVALLRGINVGGKNLIRMPDLAACFTEAGYADVRTYIQSGNVLFGADRDERPVSGQALERAIEDALTATFDLRLRVVVRSHTELTATVASAPDGFGWPDRRCDVLFLKHPATADEALAALPDLAEGVDRVWPGPDALYFARLTAKATRSRLNRVIGAPIYQQMTIRNWNTTSKLLALLDGQP
ncbi:DUF1697 domain-containing protein [Frankia sp. CNm7]|uniref:DUF1697 domain-containing protein n=1 Tax=Frankia nepalensis TaxID=1836974 RepID=A0A937RQP9_9ACTN|nr:DUF1697 domain-containing protein [Frankia nepalensis]MBL7500199.1 DUF1697 domain-containing protein [Frankia nepalensis]MBL7509421.1 DUF1697 domain-containing protein [Frankia nepalensis]MBL7522767.1 DUF1697 domain-containing protein [Frankia nepalensis]MBL7631629.1 DUF1697 domain-containing protein [Frankia nepalensis]